MLPAEILSSREKKELFSILKEQWGIEIPDSLRHQAWLRNKHDRLFLCTRSLEKIPFEQIRIQKAGTYLGTMVRGKVRLSVEGSQILGPLAKKNILDLTDEQAHAWMRGKKVKFEDKERAAWVLVRHGSDFLGSGRLSKGVLHNYVPKERRLKPDAEPFS